MITIKNLRKYISLFLIFTMMFQICTPFLKQGIFAAADDDDGSPYSEEGVIKFTTTSTKATSSIRYRTVGWTIHRQRVETCNPTQVGIPYAQVFLEQVREADLGAQVKTYFEVPEDLVNIALHQANMPTIQTNDIIILSPIYEVRKYDTNGNYTVIGIRYDNLQGIKSAQNWANPNDFFQYFNKEMVYKSSKNHVVSKEIVLNGSHIPVLSQEIIKTETGKTVSVNYDATYTYNNVTYELERTYYVYELEKTKKLGNFEYPENANALNRQIEVAAGGVKVYGEYKSTSKPKLTVRHINANTNQILDETVTEITSGASITEAAKDIPNMIFISSNYSRNSGTTWTNSSQENFVTIDNIKDNVIISFYYTPMGKIAAALTLRASPNIIEAGQTATVEFTLDASGSYCDERTTIVKYEFWLQTDENFGNSPDYNDTAKVKVVSKSGVKPDSTYYGKVRVTDGYGNTAEAYAEVYIDELYVAPAAVAKADLQVVLAQNNYYTLSYEEFGSGVYMLGSHRYRMEIRIPSSYQYDADGNWRDDDVGIDFLLDASRSSSTNGINPYHFVVTYPDRISSLGIGNRLNEQELETSSATTSTFSHTFGWSIEDAYNGVPHSTMYESGWALDSFSLGVTDSVDTTAKDRTYSYIIYRYVFDKAAPTVSLEINRNEFAYAETGYFTPSVVTGSNTYDVSSVWWEILSESGSVIENGRGLIPSEYKMYLPEGEYKARQYIEYEKDEGYFQQEYAQVKFTVVPLRDPDVTIVSDKDKYNAPATAYYTVEYISDIGKTFLISDHEYAFKDHAGNIILSGEGTFPEDYYFDIYTETGIFTAEQTIYWFDYDGNQHSKTASCIISVTGLVQPDVSISSDKDKYVAPVSGYFMVTYKDDSSTFPIAQKEYKLKNSKGEVVSSGTGTFTSSYFFDVNMVGTYTAEQTIYWQKRDELLSKTASCSFRVISPVPVADFTVSMKTSTADTWLRIDRNNGYTGKQYRQIRIDLTPSVELNKSLENPYDVLFASPNTQIQIIPLNSSGNPDIAQNATIKTPVSSDISIISNTVTIAGKQYADIRFDSYGTYRVNARVANAYYTSEWVSKEIIIREDLPPIIRSMTLTDTSIDPDTGGQVVYRKDDLHASYGLIIDAAVQDDDELDYGSAKLSIQYDYNADGDVTNDGNYSKMYVTLNNNYLLDCFHSVTKDATMSSFTFNMFSSGYPILGKVRFEYSISKTPTIPYFISDTMPALNIPSATSSNITEYHKTVMVDNHAGTVTVELAKEGLLEIVIFMDADNLYFDLDALITTYKDTAKIYIVDRNGIRTLVN